MSCLLSFDWSSLLERVRPPREWVEWGGVSASSFGLIVAAEMGDKSQLVCMTLAARYHRALPIVAGATAAFAMLNLAAVIFGAAVARWVPEFVVGAAVAVLFAFFGLRSLLAAEEDEDGEETVKSGHGMFLTTLLMIFAAEFGDKTQLAVAGMGAAFPPTPVWLGATLALATTSALGVWAGRTLLRRMPVHLLHRLSGVLFLGFAAFAAWRLLPEGAVGQWVEVVAAKAAGLWRR
ncbi:TMEM165/GDT1 family protein [Methylococcus sp. EFPC2]|uniref:TMEM165/GDT1 family protein n=1 Tax=Methylococcus sp. EFPC2 TaxID=2812648 RepID=UPI0019678E1D|nr:TMEM165/GDT1 family protein [Methylococcus sp. EFPC2]QSA97137.1 TMEM165/GDT1 family protein [Methylococcus sp. EFPC2]